EITIDFPGAQTEVEEGEAVVEIRAFDRAFFNNASEKLLRLKVDFRRPYVELLSTQHNVRRGGSQVAFYRVVDEDVAISGVKVGNDTFLGFPARGIDEEFQDKTLHV